MSLHNRFVRIPNEIAGKSSWWTIDPRAKQVRGRRRIQSNDNANSKAERRRPNKNNSQDTSHTQINTNSPSFDYLFATDPPPPPPPAPPPLPAPPSSSSNDVFSSVSSSSFTSVRDMNKNLYNLLQSTCPDHSSSSSSSTSSSTSSTSLYPSLSSQPILHDMLKSTNLNDNQQFNSGLSSLSSLCSLLDEILWCIQGWTMRIRRFPNLLR